MRRWVQLPHGKLRTFGLAEDTAAWFDEILPDRSAFS